MSTQWSGIKAKPIARPRMMSSITVDRAPETLPVVVWTPAPPKSKAEAIRDIVVDYYGLTLEEFVGRGRMPNMVDARAAFVWLCRKKTNLSYPAIAKMMKPEGKRYNHSTSKTAMQRAILKREEREKSGENKQFDDDISALLVIIDSDLKHRPAANAEPSSWTEPR